MTEIKKAWTTPVITKVMLEFDKEMTTNCYGSGKTPQSNGKGCGVQSSGTCWSTGNINEPGVK